MKLLTAFTLLVLISISNSAFAHCVRHQYYAGAGFGINSLNQYDDATGFQFFGGYCFKNSLQNPKLKTSVEAGFAQSGDFERTEIRGANNPNFPPRVVQISQTYSGIWLAGVGEYKLDSKIHLMARGGVDVGDDNGLLLGIGVGFNMSRWAQFRAEYVARDHYKSLQLNILSEF